MTRRPWVAALVLATIAAACCCLVVAMAISVIKSTAESAWFEAGFRSMLVQTVLQVADQKQREHLGRADVARAIVDHLRAIPGVSAAVVDDNGALIAGSKDLVADLRFPSYASAGMQFKPPAAGMLTFGARNIAFAVPSLRPHPPAVVAGPFDDLPPTLVGGEGLHVSVSDMPQFGFGRTSPLSILFGSIDVPRSFVRIPGAAVVVATQDFTLTRLQRTLRYAVPLLLLLTFAAIFFSGRAMLGGVMRPVDRVRTALEKVGREHARPEILGQEDGLGRDLVLAYNAAAERMIGSYRHRVEVESRMREFVADAGHELRTPLAVIMGYVQLMRKNAKPDDALANRVFPEIEEQGRRMGLLIQKLLLLTRLESQEPTDVKIIDAGDIANSMVDAFRPIADGAMLTVQTDRDAFVRVSESEMREAVGNLIDNALKYAPGSHIETTVRALDDSVLVAVTDDGPGMSPEVRTRAFERFARGEIGGSISGSGLGLAIVERAVERAGGSVALDSALGRGTRVELRFPSWRGEVKKS